MQREHDFGNSEEIIEKTEESTENNVPGGVEENVESGDGEMPDSRSIREKAYDWLYAHNVTVKVMDRVLIGLAILLVVVVIIGMLQ